MKKLCLLFLSVLVASCMKFNNPIIGSWVDITSQSDGASSFNLARKTTQKYYKNHNFEEKVVMQVSFDKDNANVEFCLYGTWEMNGESLIINIDKQKTGEEYSYFKKTTNYTVITLDGNNLEVMAEGRIHKYKKAK